jgi:hypothetical protein
MDKTGSADSCPFFYAATQGRRAASQGLADDGRQWKRGLSLYAVKIPLRQI